MRPEIAFKGIQKSRQSRLRWLCCLAIGVAVCLLSAVPLNAQRLTFIPYPGSALHSLQPEGVPAMDKDTIYSASDSGIIARSRIDASLKWRASLHRYIPSSVQLSGDTLLVAEDVVYALSAASGHELWSFKPAANTSLGIAATAGQQFFVGTAAGTLYCLSVGGGHLKWEIPLAPANDRKAVVRGIATDETHIYVSVEVWLDTVGNTIEGRLYVVDRNSGYISWQYSTASESEHPARTAFTGPALIIPGLLILSDALGNAVRAISPQSGKLLWKFSGRPGFVGPPAVPLFAEEHIIVASGDGFVSLLDPHSGKLLKERSLTTGVFFSALCGDRLLIQNGTLHTLSVSTLAEAAPVLPATNLLRSQFIASPQPNVVVALGSDGLYSMDCNHLPDSHP